MDDGCGAKNVPSGSNSITISGPQGFLLKMYGEMLRFTLAHAFQVVHWLKKIKAVP